RVRVLRDEDIDGRYESVRTFAEGLLMPTGLQFYGDGVLVTVGGECLLLRDTDGDGRADDRSPILGGFAVENPQLRVNDPDLGPDMQYYLANGLRSSRADIAGQSLSIGNRDMRWDPRTRRAQAITGPSQFGMTWDRFGNRYFCSNRNPCDAVLLEAEWAAKSPLAGLAPLTESTLPAGERSTVHPRVSAWTTSNLHAGQFTAACGLLISDSRHLPFASLGNALTCEPTGSLVHRVGLGRANGRTYPEEPPRDREWLSSDDPWFRPVNLEEGPEGAIYIVDMHRAVIEHPDWVPEELKHRPDERWGEDCGRIYRVLRHDAPKLDPIFAELRARPLRTRSTAELIELMHHHNLWMRATAARILMDRDDSNMDAELVQACRRHPRSPGLLLTVNLLRQRGAWDRGLLELITECFDTPQSSVTAVSDPALRAGLWRACESFESWTLGMWGAAHGSFASREELLACLEGMPRVLSNSTLMWPMMVDAACEFADDPHVLSGLAAFNRERLPQFTRAWMESARKRLQEKKLVTRFHSPSIRKLVASVAKPDDETWLATRQAWLEDALAQATRTASDENERRSVSEPSLRWAWSVAQGIAESPDRAWLGEQTVLWQGWVAQGLEGNLTEATRSEWLDLMGIAIAPDQSAQCAAALSAWIERNTDPALTQRALAAWSKHADASLTDWILEHFSSATPSIRGELFRALRAREDRLTAWLDALDRGEQSLQRLDASQLQSLQSVSGSLQPRIQKLLAGRISKDRQTVIDRVAPSIDLRGDRQRGKQLFAQHCASCHRIDDVGNAVGPDISDSRTQSPMQLLVAILDPNRTIDNNYFRVTVKMREGEVHDGIAIEESSQHLTLKNAQSPRLVLNKDEIESVRSSGISLMPEGIESQLDPAAMNDLISYIKQWRYVGDAAGIAK
ncbi:MAG: PVC-type heme-binding CxxCH protein, partial [Pirellula sp.]